MTIEILDLTEVCQAFVICKDLNGERRTMEVMPLGLQGVDDGKEVLVIDIIVLFCQNK